MDYRQFQSTHPSGVRHPPNNNQPSLHISIHAPQWGATESRRGREGQGRISIPVGCDVARLTVPATGSQFQSTHPSGVRPSIPARRGQGRKFQSTHPSGVRRLPYSPLVLSYSFQSTHPSGVRLVSGLRSPRSHVFQSTHPSGVRRATRASGTGGTRISIHAPQWGATRSRIRIRLTSTFQSTHPSGVRLYDRRALFVRYKFQSTHPSGVRRESWSMT